MAHEFDEVGEQKVEQGEPPKTARFASVNSGIPSKSWLALIRSYLRSFGTKSMAAARLATAQTRKAHLTTVKLPAAYLDLGRDILSAGRFRDEFADLFSQVGALQQERERLRCVQVDRGRPRSLSEKASDAASRIKTTAQARMLAFKEGSLLRRLGESSYDRYGDGSGPERLVRPIAECRSNLAVLDREIDRLSGIGHGRHVTPKRILVGVLGSCVVVIGLMAVKTGTSNRSARAQPATEAAARLDEPRQGPGVKLLRTEDRSKDQTGAAGPTVASTIARVSDFSKVDYYHDFSKDDYESIPVGAVRDSRTKLVEKSDVEAARDDDDEMIGKCLEEMGYVDSRGKFVRHGRSIVWHDDKKLRKNRECRWLDGELHGVHTTWHSNGSKLREMTFVHGKARGAVQYWFPDGVLSTSSACLDDKEHGLQTQWHPNGQKESEVAYVSGLRQGEMRTWHKNGQLSKVSTFSGGKQQGGARCWNEEGVLLFERNYKDDLVDGEETWYFSAGPKKGKSMGTALYQAGRLIRPMLVPQETTRSEFLAMMKDGSAGYDRSREQTYVWWENLWKETFGPPARGPAIRNGEVDNHYIYRCSDGIVILRRGSGLARQGQIIWVLEE